MLASKLYYLTRADINNVSPQAQIQQLRAVQAAASGKLNTGRDKWHLCV